jgi:putative ABC transport system permease protein
VDRPGTVILLTLRDLQHRAIRFVVVTLLAAVVFTLLFVMTGLVEQFHREPVDTVEAIGASSWVLPVGVSGPFTASSTMPAGTIDAVDADVTAPVVVARASIALDGDTDPADAEEVIVVGHDAETLGAPPVSDGRTASSPGEAVIDSTLDADVGDEIVVGGVPFDVVGTSSNTTLLAGIPLVFVTTGDAQDLVYNSREVISAVLADGDVRSTPDGTAVLTDDEVAADAFGPIESAVASVDLVRGLLWVVAAVIIGAVVYLSALERQRDFAVLKAVGASNRTLMASLAIQAVLVALVAVALAAVLQMVIAPMFPLRVQVPARAFWQLPLFAAVLALVAGAAGMRKVAGSDPALAFAGAGG